MPTQKRAEETRERVLQAAASVFASAGYRAATMQEVAELAGVTQGALYFHFRSKPQLAAGIIERQHQLSIEAGRRHLDISTSGIEGMIALSGTLARQIVSSSIVQAGLRMSTESAHELGEAAVSPYREWIQACESFLSRANAAGELADGLDIQAAANVIISAFSGTQFVSVALSGSSDLLARLVDMWRLLLPGLLDERHRGVIERVPDLLLISQPWELEVGNNDLSTVSER